MKLELSTPALLLIVALVALVVTSRKPTAKPVRRDIQHPPAHVRAQARKDSYNQEVRASVGLNREKVVDCEPIR